ncbi:MAG: hypothetical protein MRJ68_05480 [Nitrospira sp.]|nr:hypothetical protein [Nitrospira sp.]
MAEQIQRTRREHNGLGHDDERHLREQLDMETDVGGETMSNLETSAAYGDGIAVKVAAERYGQLNGPCEAGGKLS